VVSGEANEIIRVHNGPRTAHPIKIAGIPAGTLNLMNHSFGYNKKLGNAVLFRRGAPSFLRNLPRMFHRELVRHLC
jgi:hypothetical protein